MRRDDDVTSVEGTVSRIPEGTDRGMVTFDLVSESDYVASDINYAFGLPTQGGAFSDVTEALDLELDPVIQGDRLAADGAWHVAAEAYAVAVARDPERNDIRIQLAHALKESGNLEAAERVYREVIRIDENEFETMVHLAHLLKNIGKFREAIDLFYIIDRNGLYSVESEISYLETLLSLQSVVAEENDDLVAADFVAKGNRARGAGWWEDAAIAYRAALSAEAEQPAIWVQLGHALKESGCAVDAAAAYRQALAHEPDNQETELHLAHLLKSEEQFADALQLFERLHASGAYDVGADIAYIRQRMEESADSSVTKSPDELPPAVENDTAAAYIRRGNELRDAGEWEDAAQAYNAALAREPGRAPIWTQLGHCLKEVGRILQAELAYRKARSLDPDGDAGLHLAHLFKMQGKLGDALELFETLQEAGLFDVDDEIRGLEAALAQAEDGDVGDVDGSEERRVEGGSDEDEGTDWISIADRHRAAQQWEDAGTCYRRALDRQPQLGHIWVQYGHCLKEGGQRDAAVAAYRAACALDEQDADPWLHLGFLLKSLGRRDEAIAAFRKLVALSDQPHIREEIRTLEERGVGEIVIGGSADIIQVVSPASAAASTAHASERPSVYTYRIERADERGVRGWVVLPDAPDTTVEIDILIGSVHYARTLNTISRADLRQAGVTGGRGGFQIMFAPELFDRGPVELSIGLPDGGRSHAVRIAAATQVPRRTPVRWDPGRTVSIIVPIHNAFDDVAECVKRLFTYTTAPARLILIDDASTDGRIIDLLRRVEAMDNVTVLRNERNRGFTYSVNRGIAYAARDDVVLLNSDARVTPRWLEGLLSAVAQDNGIGTVTAMSDRAGAFSAPDVGNDNCLPPGISEEEFARAFRRGSSNVSGSVSVPTGNGFCLYVRRALFDSVGLFDEMAFPRGYGEENEFCMRAVRAGWRHVIDDRTYVFHERGRSFGNEKDSLLEAGRAVVDRRYPEYARLISRFGTDPRLTLARFRARQAQSELALEGGRKHALFVLSTLSGGTPHTNQDLMKALSAQWACWVLVCDARVVTLSRLDGNGLAVVARHELVEPVEPITHVSFDYDRIVGGWLDLYEFDIVHIRHMGWHSLTLPRLARRSGAAVVMSLHDFHVVCPSIKLLDDSGAYCGGQCGSGEGDCAVELWPQDMMPRLKNGWVRYWRDRYAAALADCDAFVTTSPHARDTILRGLPALPKERFHVIPHGRDFPAFSSVVCPREGRDERVRILVPGNINQAKGRDVIMGLLERDTAGRLEFHIMGRHQFLSDHPRLIVHGPYHREEFAVLAEKIAPDVGAVFSIWDETWCHTLTELWAVGLPVIVLDYPTVAGRVRESGAGWVYSNDDLDTLYAAIISDLFDRQGIDKRYRAVAHWQETAAKEETAFIMSLRYQQVYGSAMERRAAESLVFRAPEAI